MRMSIGAIGFLILVIFFVVRPMVRAARSTGQGFGDSLGLGGTAARGILLAVASTGAKAGTNRESRRVTIDIEIPGQPPYEVRTVATFPTCLRGDVLPGATVELRVHPRNRNAPVSIVGPGVGFGVTQLNVPGAS
jgi:hypothetical protein